MAEEKSLVKRLTRQLASKGNDNAKGMAISILQHRGQLTASGKLTPAGKERQSMGAAGRAKDRASRASGHPPTDFKYNPKTNRATLK